MDAITAACRTTFRAYHTSGTRDVKEIIWLCLHSTETRPGTAASVARYFSEESSEGSAHLVIDDNECYRCLDNKDIPWAAPGANQRGLHIEQCGFAAWTAKGWLAHPHMLERTAYKLALHAHAFHIPLVFVMASGLRAGHKGVTTHAEVSKAFPNNVGNHHDPGVNYPIAHVMQLARGYLANMDV